MINPFVPVVNSLLPEPQAGLLNGILFGIKANMAHSLYQAMRDTGVLHIIALSGMNISILVNLVAKVTLFLGRKISIMATLIIISAFVVFVGPSPSIVRAAIMGGMSLIAIYLGRQSWSILSLFLTSGIMLLVRPNWLGEISFQLSFLSTLGIILAVKLVKRKQSFRLLDQLKYAFKENLALTLSAQLFTLPIILYNFHRLSLISPLANLLIGWTMQPIMILGFVAATLGLIFLPLGFVPALMTWVPLTYLVKVVEWLAKVPGASIEF